MLNSGTESWFQRARTPILLGAMVGCAALGAIAYTYVYPPAAYSISVPHMATSTLALQYGALPALGNLDYYKEVKESFILEKAPFIDANLTEMRLRVYSQGIVALEVPIVAKGKEGSWWETPAGIYKIQTKETSHYSSFGDVYMPYSMDFQGNFFIHGWPYYEDGKPVATSFSGGCIRLNTDDAKKVFELASVGMPVVVYNESPVRDSFGYQLKGPAITATHHLVADLDSHIVLMSQGASSTAPIASVTKLLTALVATEYINLDKEITVTRDSLVYTSVPRLKAGEAYRAYDLLFLLMQESSNEAAEALARHLGRQRFVTLMNDKARAIGLNYTLFSDPSGAKNDLSTPEDLFKLLQYIDSNRRFIFEITGGVLTNSAYGTPAFSRISNFNRMKNIPADFIGGKIGQTNDAGETFAGVYAVQVGEQRRSIAVIVLGSKDAANDVSKLIGFVKNQYAPAALPRLE